MIEAQSQDSLGYFSRKTWLKICYVLLFAYIATHGRFLSLFYKVKLQLSDYHIGKLLSFGKLISIIASPFWSYLADNRIGRRSVVILCTVGLTLTFSLYTNQALHRMFVGSDENHLFGYYVAVALISNWFYCGLFPCVTVEALTFFENEQKPLKAEHAQQHVEVELSQIQSKQSDDLKFLVGGHQQLEVDESLSNEDKKKSKSRYGELRKYGAVGWGAFNVVLGILLDITSDFMILVKSSFIMGCILIIVVWYSFEPFNYRSPVQSLANSVSWFSLTMAPFIQFVTIFILDKYNIILLLTMYIGACGMILVEQLVFLYFVEELHFSYFLCGMTVLVTVLFHWPLFHYSQFFVQRLGFDKMICIALTAYSLRVLMYTVIPEDHKELILLFEVLHSVTIAFMETGVTLKINYLSPKGTETTFIGIALAIEALGYFTGEFLGGMSFEYFGRKLTYRVAACVVGVVNMLFFLSSKEISALERLIGMFADIRTSRNVRWQRVNSRGF